MARCGFAVPFSVADFAGIDVGAVVLALGAGAVATLFFGSAVDVTKSFLLLPVSWAPPSLRRRALPSLGTDAAGIGSGSSIEVGPQNGSGGVPPWPGIGPYAT